MNRCIISVHVVTNAKENSVKETIDENEQSVYKIRTTAKPKDGEANEAVIKIIAKHLNVAQKCVKIVRGFSCRTKFIEIIR